MLLYDTVIFASVRCRIIQGTKGNLKAPCPVQQLRLRGPTTPIKSN